MVGEFTQTNTCGTALLQGGNCSFTVSFAPSQRGVARGSAVIATNGLGGTQTVELVGTATVVELLPQSLNFGTHIVGMKSRVRRITLRNTSDMTLHISGIALAGLDAGDFTQTNNCGIGLHGGASCTLLVTFKPSAQGSRAASLAINDDGGASPQLPSLTGTGK